MRVAVVGAGIVGAATARALAVRGVDVDLFDAGEVSGGTTGLGEGNVLCSDKDAGPELELAVLGRAAFDDIERRYGELARIRRKGALVVHRDAAGLAAEPARLERLQAAGVRCELLEPEQARALEPGLAADLLGASYFPDDLQCDPRAIARALAEEARAAGARVHTHTRVERILPGEGVRIAGADVAGRRGRARRRRRGAPSSPAARASSCRSSRARASSPGSAAALTHPPQGRRRRLSRRRRGARGRAAGLHRARDDVGRRRARRLEPRAPRLRRHGRPRRHRGHAGARGGVMPEVARLAVVGAWAGLRPWLPDRLPALGPSRPCPGCGSPPATRAPGSASARSAASWWPRPCAENGLRSI